VRYSSWLHLFLRGFALGMVTLSFQYGISISAATFQVPHVPPAAGTTGPTNTFNVWDTSLPRGHHPAAHATSGWSTPPLQRGEADAECHHHQPAAAAPASILCPVCWVSSVSLNFSRISTAGARQPHATSPVCLRCFACRVLIKRPDGETISLLLSVSVSHSYTGSMYVACLHLTNEHHLYLIVWGTYNTLKCFTYKYVPPTCAPKSTCALPATTMTFDRHLSGFTSSNRSDWVNECKLTLVGKCL
jgi:hypothetical protein